MKYALNTQGLVDCKADCLVVAIPENGDWPASAEAADQQLDGMLKQAVKQGDFSGKRAPPCCCRWPESSPGSAFWP